MSKVGADVQSVLAALKSSTANPNTETRSDSESPLTPSNAEPGNSHSTLDRATTESVQSLINKNSTGPKSNVQLGQSQQSDIENITVSNIQPLTEETVKSVSRTNANERVLSNLSNIIKDNKSKVSVEHTSSTPTDESKENELHFEIQQEDDLELLEDDDELNDLDFTIGSDADSSEGAGFDELNELDFVIGDSEDKVDDELNSLDFEIGDADPVFKDGEEYAEVGFDETPQVPITSVAMVDVINEQSGITNKAYEQADILNRLMAQHGAIPKSSSTVSETNDIVKDNDDEDDDGDLILEEIEISEEMLREQKERANSDLIVETPLTETKTTNELLDEYYLTISEQINQLSMSAEQLVKFIPDDLDNLVHGFIQKRYPAIEAIDFDNYTMRDLVDGNNVDNGVSKVHLLYEQLNIVYNKEDLQKMKTSYFSTVEGQCSDIVESIETDSQELMDEISDYESAQERQLGNIYLSLIEALKEQVDNIRSEIGSSKDKIIEHEISKYSEELDRVQSIVDKVSDSKTKLESILGKNFVNRQSDSIDIPTDFEELSDLVSDVELAVEELEISEKSVYKKYVGKVWGVITAPAKTTTTHMRGVVISINLLAIAVVLTMFREIAIVALTVPLALDLYRQYKLSQRNGHIDYLVEFTNKSSEIVENLRNGVISKIVQEWDETNEELNLKLDAKFNAITKNLKDAFEHRKGSIAGKYDTVALLAQVTKATEKKTDSVENSRDDAVEGFHEGVDKTIVSLDEKLEVVNRELAVLDRFDIYSEGNEGLITFNRKIKVGEYVSDSIGAIDHYMNFEEGSYYVYTDTYEQKVQALNLMKTLAIQQMYYQEIGQFKLNCVDITNSANDLMDLYSEETVISEIFTSDEQLNVLVKDTVTELENRYRAVLKNYKSVTDFNSHAKEIKEKPFPYLFNIYFNIGSEMVRSRLFQNILMEGGTAGITSVVFVCREEITDNKGKIDDGLLKLLDETCDYKLLNTQGWNIVHCNKNIIPSGKILPEKPFLNCKPNAFNRTHVVNKMEEAKQLLEASRQSLVLYKQLKEMVIPEFHQHNTLKGIKICVGFIDGDLSKPEFVELGDELVHAMMGGKTGAGKSNTINVILANLCGMYSPEWLELYMVDFKNVEFNFYTETVRKGPLEKKVCYIPHTSMIAGTTDAEYALSVFENVLTEMERRKKVLANGIELDGEIYTFKNVQEYNTFVLKHEIKLEHPILPRILLMLDEFQVMFQIEDDNVITKIKSYITRLSKEARSMGIHMFFTSQSMAGTLSEDVKGQFAMRWCLSATEATSKELIGNGASASLKGKGFIYMNGSADGNPDDNMLFKIPFIPSDYLKEHMLHIRELCRGYTQENPNIPFHTQDFYDEAVGHDEHELSLYARNEKVANAKNAIILGQKTVYKNKSIPENFTLGFDDTENGIIVGNEKIAVANLFNTVIESFRHKPMTRILIANFDRTMDGFINTQHSFKGTEVFNRATSPAQLFNAIQSMIAPGAVVGEDDPLSPNYLPAAERAKKKANQGQERFDPSKKNRWVVFIVGLHKASGFDGDMADEKLMSQLVTLLKTGPSKGVNFFINYRLPFRATKILPQCSYRLSSKTDEDTSFAIFGNRKAKNLFVEDNVNVGYFRSNFDDSEFKFKIYNFDYDPSLLLSKELDDFDVLSG